jgi:hypothetical protein
MSRHHKQLRLVAALTRALCSIQEGNGEGERMQRTRRIVQERGRTPGIDSIHRLKVPVLALIATLAILGMLPSSLLRVETAKADSPSTLSILFPVPNSTTALGPVGTNITITGSGFAASVTLQLGSATHDAGCSSGFQPFSNLSVMADGTGSFQTTFTWPASLANEGTAYYVCAQDPSNALTQSQTTFTVAGTQSPAIAGTKPVPGPAPGPGTPALPTTGYYPGSTVEIDGTSFLPDSTPILAYLTTSQISAPSDFTSAVQLTPVGGQQITSTNNGQVTATVKIPSSQTPGTYFLYLVSADGRANDQQIALPSLIAGSAAITVATAPPPPTATATSAAATPSPTPRGSSTGTGGTSGPGPGKLAAIVGLSGLSVVLFIIGVILLASAASLPRQA